VSFKRCLDKLGWRYDVCGREGGRREERKEKGRKKSREESRKGGKGGRTCSLLAMRTFD